MFTLCKKFLQKANTCIVLVVIACFAGAAFHSCLKILEKEQSAITNYQLKIAEISELQALFDDMQGRILLYFDSNKPAPSELERISDIFGRFQNEVIHFNDKIAVKASIISLAEINLINGIQQNISAMVPYVREAAEGGDNRLSRDILSLMTAVGEKLDKFGEHQISDEKIFLSTEAFEERRQSIFIAIILLSLSSFFLIIFLIIKNRQLELANIKRHEILEIADQRIAAIEASKDGIGIMDAEKRLIYMNSALRDMHGIKEEDAGEYIGKDWKELYNNKGKAHIEGNVYPILKALGAWQGESRIKRKDNKIIEAELTLSLLPNGKGMIGTARDITERRQAERENRELQSQVHQAQKMEAIGRLAGGMAHDFNNILAAIIGYAEFLSEDLNKNKKLQKYAENILLAGNKGRVLIDQMLSFSRRKETIRDVVDLNAAIREVLYMIEAGLPKSIVIETDINCDGPVYINGDPSQIAQALINICVNAIDAMENEKGELRISLTKVEPDEDSFEGIMVDDYLSPAELPPTRIYNVGPGHTGLEFGQIKRGTNYFQLSVSDTGTGMSEVILQHIFEPFFTTKSVDKGTGLGMANVHGTILSHHGAITIDTVVMGGTTFDLYFPEADYINDLALLSPDYNDRRVVDFSGIRILAVDDQPEVLSMIETLLTRSGFECVSKSSAEDALHLLEEAHDAFDLVITDQNMPNMTGVDLAEKCAALNYTMPFIIISGYSHEKLTEIRSKVPNIKVAIRKPARKDAILKAIETALKETI